MQPAQRPGGAIHAARAAEKSGLMCPGLALLRARVGINSAHLLHVEQHLLSID